MPKIGIGITCHNRNDMSSISIAQWKKFLPKNSKLVIVDDASDIPIKNATFRFDRNVGIAKAKNKCIELLEECTYIFLADDDIYPTKKGFEQRYIDAFNTTGCHFFSMIFSHLSDGRSNGNKRKKDHGNLIEYSHPSGVLLFMTNHCIKTVGGMDTAYGRYGYEHCDLQRRVFNKGLSPYKFCDIPNSMEGFYVHDYHKTVRGTVSNKKSYFRKVARYYQMKERSKQFIPYK